MRFNLSDSTEKKIVKFGWRFFFSMIGLIFLMFVIISFQDLPTFEQLENPQQYVASEVYAEDMSVLGRYYLENRILIDFNNLSPCLVKALLATEDERFYRHSGIDFKALARVGVKTILLRRADSGGGSTITQQLAKLLFERPNLSEMGILRKTLKLIITKFKEWIVAVKLEREYTKEEILAMYLNHFDFLYNSHGIQAASETYFGKNQEDLTIEEAAMLIGMLKNPSLYNPMRRADLVKQRRMVVLKQMENQRYISREIYDSLKVLPLEMTNFKKSSHATGLAPYFRMEMRKKLKDILSREEHLKPDGTPYNIDRDGLKIYTTIDRRMQEHAEASMIKHMRNLQARFFDHWDAIRQDPWNYTGDNSDIELKQNALKEQIFLTERYRLMRENILSPTLVSIDQEYDLVLSDFMIRKLIQEDEQPGVLNVLQTQGIISRFQKETFRKLLKSEFWTNLKQDWLSLQQQVDEVFETKVRMKVFTFENPNFEKDTVMSPIDSIKYHRKHLQTGILAIDPRTGHIKAWVGGIQMQYFQQDHIHTSRQVGSTFKPIIYSTAIAFQGISPCSKVFDVQYTINKGEGNFHLVEDWSPKNSDGRYSMKPITLYEGLRESKNTLSVFLMKQIGDVESVRNLAENLGIEKQKLPPVPSLCLGSADISLFEMTGAYASFANNGIYNQPVFIKQIEDKNGKLIYRAIPEERRILQEDANFVMVDMLRYAAAYRGGAQELKCDFGGKTGTTQNQTDGWFIGITPNLVIGTWVGGEDRWIRFRDLAIGQGSVMARPIVIDMLKKIEADPDIDFDSSARFYKPAKLSITINCEEYNRLNPGESNEIPDQGRRDDFF